MEALDRDDRKLVEALRAYSKNGGPRPDFPFDTLNYTLWTAAIRIENLAERIAFLAESDKP